jgi:hypothetical protein
MELSPLTGDLLASEVQYWAFVHLELHPMEALVDHGSLKKIYKLSLKLGPLQSLFTANSGSAVVIHNIKLTSGSMLQ